MPASGGVTLAYDPLLRLHQVASASATARFAYDGVEPIAEYDAAGALQERTVFGPASDEPILQYDASGARSWLTADERGSVVALADDSGTATAINSYDEYGKPASTNAGRFQYTGQMWLPELGAYSYKARFYAPRLGTFLQSDPIGYSAGANLYSYVEGDPVNGSDPLGLTSQTACVGGSCDSITVTGQRWTEPEEGPYLALPGDFTSMPVNNGEPPDTGGADGPPIVITAPKPKPADDPIVVTAPKPSTARIKTVERPIVITGARLYMARDERFQLPPPPSGGPFHGCDEFFRVCVNRANQAPDDAEAHKKYLNCRQIAKQCNSAVLTGRYGWVNLPGVGVVLIYKGQSTWWGPDQ